MGARSADGRASAGWLCSTLSAPSGCSGKAVHALRSLQEHQPTPASPHQPESPNAVLRSGGGGGKKGAWIASVALPLLLLRRLVSGAMILGTRRCWWLKVKVMLASTWRVASRVLRLSRCSTVT
jgi:hypothetical protein